MTDALAGDNFEHRREVFGVSTRRHELGEEELLRAAIERLPTYDRLRKVVLNGSAAAVFDEVDVTKLGIEMQEKKKEMKSMLKLEDDNEKFLRSIRNKVDRVGLETPKIEVRYYRICNGNESIARRIPYISPLSPSET